MSDVSEPSSIPEGNVPLDETQQETRPTQPASVMDLSIPEQPGAGEGDQEGGFGFEQVQLLSRLLMGALMLGSDELMHRLRSFQRELEAGPGLPGSRLSPVDETPQDLLRYLAIGLYLRGQRGVAEGVRRGVRFSLGTTSRALRTLNRLTDNPLARPLRRSATARLRGLGEEADRIIDEGRREEQNARLLAGQALGGTIDEVIDYVSESPEMAELIRRVVAQQSKGFAGVVADNARRVTVTADYVAEGVLRRLLGRRRRGELPASPLMGKPQDMYSFDTPEQEEDDHDR